MLTDLGRVAYKQGMNTNLEVVSASETRTPCYGHTSESTALLVDGYPYGGLTCQIRFWIERDAKRGFRFVSQTCNPKTDR